MTVHDHFASYLSPLPDETEHGVCNLHLLRNLKEFVEQEKETDSWAARMQRLLIEARDAAVDGFDTAGGLCRSPSAKRRPQPGTLSWRWSCPYRPADVVAVTICPCGRSGILP